MFPADTAVTENEAISFVNELEQKLLASNNTTGVLLLDNASNQRSFAVRTCEPDLRVFAMVGTTTAQPTHLGSNLLKRGFHWLKKLFAA